MRNFLKYFSAFVIIFCIAKSAAAKNNVIRPKIYRILVKLNKTDEIHFGYPVGISGIPETKNKFYRSFLKLKRKASNKELESLALTESALTKIYAFEILAGRNDSSIKNIFISNQHDSSFFSIAAGCTGLIDKVNRYMLMKLSPREPCTYCFTNKEYEWYYAQVGEIR